MQYENNFYDNFTQIPEGGNPKSRLRSGFCSHFKEEVTHICGKPKEVQESDTSRALIISLAHLKDVRLFLDMIFHFRCNR